jgi:hypothetical protein
MVHTSLVYSIYDSTEEEKEEAVIQRMIKGIQRMISVNYRQGGESEEGESTTEGAVVISINPAMKRHFELEIETLRNAPRDADKLATLLRIKQRQYEEARKDADYDNDDDL